MSEKLTPEAIEEMVSKAKAQAERMIETMLRQVVADFESADSEGFKLVLNIEGQRKRGGEERQNDLFQFSSLPLLVEPSDLVPLCADEIDQIAEDRRVCGRNGVQQIYPARSETLCSRP